MATFPTNIEFGRSSGYETTLRSLIAQFGDGYKQVAADGINTASRRWRLVTEPLETADYDTVDAFLRDNAGTTFTWTPPLEADTVEVTCEAFSTAYVGGSSERRISMVFIEETT